MEVLTVKQPFAQLICEGVKNIENRTWKTNFRGRVLIHTSAKYNSFFLDEAFTKQQLDDMLAHNTEIYWCGHKEWGAKYDTSAIIGSVEIVDCVRNHPSVWAEKSPENLNSFCENKGCSEFIKWDFGGPSCFSCKLVGESYNIDTIPKECPFKDEARLYMKPVWNWVLANPIMFRTPIINVKGKLSFWDFPLAIPSIQEEDEDIDNLIT